MSSAESLLDLQQHTSGSIPTLYEAAEREGVHWSCNAILTAHCHGAHTIVVVWVLSCKAC